MDNQYVFGLWIFLDLALIALGAGAFVSIFLLHIVHQEALRDIIRSAVVAGFVCYSAAVAVLMVDVGQPLRAWFTFRHPNAHSMMAEVTFCITCYLVVLTIEYAPVLMSNRVLWRRPRVIAFQFELHKLLVILAIVGLILSILHQGSLGGLYGVLQGRPSAFREGLGIWPSTFFLFIISAMAVGPCFLILITWLTCLVTRKQLVRPAVVGLLARTGGWLMLVYLVFKSLDTLVWLTRTLPAKGLDGSGFYAGLPLAKWALPLELVLLAVLPTLALLRRRPLRQRWYVLAAFIACLGVTLDRFMVTVETLAMETLPFARTGIYWPSWQELATFLGAIAYGVIVFSFSYRYLPLYPRERELETA